MAESTNISEENLKKLRNILKKTLDLRQADLGNLLKPSMRAFAEHMIQAGLMGRDQQDQDFTAIINSFKDQMDWIDTQNELEKHCYNFLNVLKELGVPTEKAAKVLEKSWMDAVKIELRIEFIICRDNQVGNPLSTTLPPPQHSHPMQPFLPPGPPFLLPHDAASVPACYIYYNVYYSVRENSSLQQNIDYQPHSNPQERLHSQPNEETPNQINSPPPHVDLEDYTSKATPSEYQDKTPHFVTIKPQESYVHSNSDASNYNLPSLPEEDMDTLSIEKINHHQHPNFSTPTSSEQCDNAYPFANDTSGQPKDEMVLTSVTPCILLPKEVEAKHTTEYRLSQLEIQMERLIQSSY